jgi:hypothetical protein
MHASAAGASAADGLSLSQGCIIVLLLPPAPLSLDLCLL